MVGFAVDEAEAVTVPLGFLVEVAKPDEGADIRVLDGALEEAELDLGVVEVVELDFGFVVVRLGLGVEVGGAKAALSVDGVGEILLDVLVLVVLLDVVELLLVFGIIVVVLLFDLVVLVELFGLVVVVLGLDVVVVVVVLDGGAWARNGLIILDVVCESPPTLGTRGRLSMGAGRGLLACGLTSTL